MEISSTSRPRSSGVISSHGVLLSYLNYTAAQSAGLISVNAAGNAILKVDNTTNDPAPGAYSTFGRDTVLIISNDTIDIGTLVVMDAYHIPYGVRPTCFVSLRRE
jgi:hypothetical protein